MTSTNLIAFIWLNPQLFNPPLNKSNNISKSQIMLNNPSIISVIPISSQISLDHKILVTSSNNSNLLNGHYSGAIDMVHV